MTSPALPPRGPSLLPAGASRIHDPSSPACTHLLNTRTASRLPLHGPRPGVSLRREITVPEPAPSETPGLGGRGLAD